MNDYSRRWQAIYTAALADVGYSTDPAQLAIIAQFARIEEALSASSSASAVSASAGQQRKASSGFFSRFLSVAEPTVSPVTGLYLFGQVGRGKTFLMDLFCRHIPFAVKRLHFHHFMKEIHAALRQLKDQVNPLDSIAADFAARYRILCLDEFMVTDITDAMLLYGLLKGLTDNGVVIVTTTNIPPNDLYKDGLQRARFLPAIDLIKERLAVHEMSAGQDFRRLCLSQRQRFFFPHSDKVQAEIETLLEALSTNLPVERNGEILINNRHIAFVASSQAVIWFRFERLCEGFRSQLDYIELANRFPVFIVTEIPLLDVFHEDAARRFLWLIDELYDRRIDLILSAAVPMEQIYSGNKITFEFERLQSRLYEMQSTAYGKDKAR